MEDYTPDRADVFNEHTHYSPSWYEPYVSPVCYPLFSDADMGYFNVVTDTYICDDDTPCTFTHHSI